MTDGEADLMSLAERCRLSPGLVAAWVEAATVLLFRFSPTSPPATTPMTTASRFTWDAAACALQLHWEAPDVRALRSHDNALDATEAAAYAISIAAARHRGYVIVGRAQHASGADLLMVREGEPDNDFVKLEVSGIAERGSVETRLANKVVQVRGGDLDRPGVGIVVHFEDAAIVARTA